ncbi:hypothetical protein R1flu_007519 [Riccia fluitans]|uniref:Uncharacterized protein n=1 Tax=Riccia fluitans TaxID=41844 RepID=A0ABD1YZY1_9MARC
MAEQGTQLLQLQPEKLPQVLSRDDWAGPAHSSFVVRIFYVRSSKALAADERLQETWYSMEGGSDPSQMFSEHLSDASVNRSNEDPKKCITA